MSANIIPTDVIMTATMTDMTTATTTHALPLHAVQNAETADIPLDHDRARILVAPLALATAKIVATTDRPRQPT